MDRAPRQAAFTLLLASCLMGAAGCSDAAEEAPAVTEQPQYDGLSPAEIESRAEPMTQEEAERLGIVDTTIRIVPPMNPDSVAPAQGPAVAPIDTAAR